MTRRILHRMYHQCGNTDTYLLLALPPSISPLFTSPSFVFSLVYRHGATHPSATLPELNPPLSLYLSFSLSPSLFLHLRISVSSRCANPISPFLSIDHLFGPTGVSFPANPSSAEFKFLHSAFGEILRNTLFDLHRCRVHGVTWSVNIFK